MKSLTKGQWALGAAPRPEPPVILVVNGGAAAWEQQRANAFRERIREEWHAARFIETPILYYSRLAAFTACVDLLKSMANGHGQIELHAVFACNDDMAIGVRSAIRTVIEGGHSFSAVTQIVGYDGISEIREYIDAKDPYIAGTVDVRVEDQARAAMLLIHRLVRSGERRNEAELIAPRAVKRAGL